MADMITDGNIKVTFVPSVANIAAPTVAELTAGTTLECLITADGADVSVSEDVISIPKLCETSNSEAPGRTTYKITLTIVRKDNPTEDVAWTTLLRKTAGFLVFRYGPPVTTAYATTQSVQVFPGTFGERMPQKPAANAAVTFQSMFYSSAVPDLDAVVA